MICESLERARRADNHRGDEHRAHVADLYGCDRQTWYRRNGHEAPDHDAAKLRKFDVGNAVEARIIAQLRTAGHDVTTGETVTFTIGPSGALLPLSAAVDARPTYIMIGHPDAVVDGDTLLEIKSTDARKVADEPSPHYALQAAAYALAIGAPKAIVHVTHVANFTKDEAEYEIEPEDYRDRVTERVIQVLERTGPRAPMPEPQPAIESAAFACNYCSYRDQCEMDGGPMPGAKAAR